MNTEEKEICPNCGNPFVEKVAYESGITVLVPANEVCLFIKAGGPHMLYFHIDGGAGDCNSKEEDESATGRALEDIQEEVRKREEKSPS